MSTVSPHFKLFLDPLDHDHTASSLTSLPAVRPYPGVDRIATLPKGSFLADNRDSRAELAGRVF